MARSWFRHDANMRFDPAVRTLGEEFGPAGIVAWTSLLELHCQDDRGITLLRSDLAAALNIPTGWGLDLEAWLERAAELKLIRVTRPRTDAASRCKVTAKKWANYQPAYETKDAARERKRRSRRKSVTVTSASSHSDISVTSHGTVRDLTNNPPNPPSGHSDNSHSNNQTPPRLEPEAGAERARQLREHLTNEQPRPHQRGTLATVAELLPKPDGGDAA